jgi:carnitine-CoA ligase
MRGTGPDLGALSRRMSSQQRTLLHVLDQQVSVRPEADWLVFDSRDHISFAQAREDGRRFAAALRSERLEAKSVALLLRNQREFIPTFLGAQLAGGFPVPLNPDLQGPLLARLLERCEAKVLVVPTALLERLRSLPSLAGVELVLVCGASSEDLPRLPNVRTEPFDEWLAAAEPQGPARLPDPWDIGALVFTSGTSGGSKAAVWTHEYLYLTSAFTAEQLGHTDTDVLSTSLQMCHIAGLQVFACSALQVGCVAHLKSSFSASRYWDEAASDEATFSMLMGQMAAMILETVPAAPPHKLERVYILPQPRERVEFERRYGTTVLWQGWGMTEIFPHPPARDPLRKVDDDTIGPAPAWVDWGVVDEHDALLEPGALGELVYRPLIPRGMASGYFRDADASARAFRNFMFHTGDLGYYDTEGNMHFVMRNQDSIRRRGENISAVELEAVALGHPAVRDAAAYAVPAPLGEHEVKLDVVLSVSLPLEQLHSWLVEQLPRYMVPKYLEQRESLPKTISQRTEKYKLAAESLERPEVQVFEASRRVRQASGAGR